MNKSKSNIVMFSIFGVLMSILHLVQCYLRIRAHQVFNDLLAAVKPSAVDEQAWIRLSDFSKYTEIMYYIVGILFFVFISYKLIYSKISFPFVLISTFIVYLATTILVIPLKIKETDVSNLLLPIYVSLSFSLICILLAAFKKHHYLKISGKL